MTKQKLVSYILIMENEELLKNLKARWAQLKDNRAKFEGDWTEAQTYADSILLICYPMIRWLV